MWITPRRSRKSRLSCEAARRSYRPRLEGLERRIALSHLEVQNEAGRTDYSYDYTADANGFGQFFRAHDSASFPIGEGGSYVEESNGLIRVASETSDPESGHGPMTSTSIYAVSSVNFGLRNAAQIPRRTAEASASREVVYKVVADPGDEPGLQVVLNVLATGTSSGSGTSTISAGGRTLAISNFGVEFRLDPGSTFAVSIGTAARASHDGATASDNSAYVDVRVFLRDVAPPTKVDLVASELKWNAASGGVDFAYEVRNIDLPKDTTIKFYWYDVGGAQRGEIHELRTELQKGSTLAQSGPHRLGRPINPGVPSGATSVRMVVDDGDAIDESSESNNALTLAYEPKFALVPKYDGDASSDVIGRFFTGPVIEGQNVTFTLPESLAAFKPTQITARLGSFDLPVTTTGGRSYVTADFDPGSLRQDTDLVIDVKFGTIMLHSERVKVDVEPLPEWLTNRTLSRKDFGFDPLSTSYHFKGQLLNVKTGNLAGFGLPDQIWFGRRISSGLNVLSELEVTSPLDRTRAPDVAATLDVDLILLGDSVYNKSYEYSSSTQGGPFAITMDLIPATLVLRGADLSYHETGNRTVNVLKDREFTVGLFHVKSAVKARLDYLLGLSLSLNASGSIGSSKLTFNLHGALSGQLLEIKLSDLNYLKTTISLLRRTNPGQLFLDVLSALLPATATPDLRLTAGVTGDFRLTGEASLLGPSSARVVDATTAWNMGFETRAKLDWLTWSFDLFGVGFLNEKLKIKY